MTPTQRKALEAARDWITKASRGGANNWLVQKIEEALAEQATPEPTLVDEVHFDQVMEERDSYHQTADELAQVLSEITGEDIGEHSNENCPWMNALSAGVRFQMAQKAQKSITPQPQQVAPKQEPHKLPIPPTGTGVTDICYVEGWNHCCDAFFGGKPAPEPVVITIKEPAPQPREWVELSEDEVLKVYILNPHRSTVGFSYEGIKHWSVAISAALRAKNGG